MLGFSVSPATTVTLSSGTNVGSTVSVGGVAVGTIAAGGTGAGANDLIVTLNSSATPANVGLLINALTYSNTNADPSVLQRTLSVSVFDGVGGTGSVTAHVDVLGINDEPTLVAAGVSPAYNEDAAAADLFSGVTASAVEAGQTFTSLTLTVSNVTDGASEILRIDGTDVALTNANSVVGTATNGLTVNVSASGGTATVSFSGASLTAAQLQALIDGLSYRNSSQNPTDANRIVTITQLRDSGSGTAPNDNNIAPNITSTVNVNPVNDTPVNSVPAAAQNIDEDVSRTFNTANGNRISIGDVDASSSEVRVTLSVQHGTLTLSGTSGLTFAPGSDGISDATMTFSGTVSAINNALDGLIYAPAADYAGSDTLTIATNDQGAAGQDPLLTGDGSSEQDSDTVTINIAAVADIADDNPTVAEDSGANALNLLGNDTFESSGRAITAVGSASHGTVAIDGKGTADPTDDVVTYTPNVDYNGSDSFTYTVTSGGVTETATAHVTVTAASDIVADSVSVLEDSSSSNALDLLANDTFESSGRAITAVGALPTER